ncbi:PEP-CTERM sorting domain-containing protein [Verrucomicrobiaceae bacterium N1E253]|uniref:PEP-CTERM sorting domain-containing protein n=1 Tax=Oceaniferula marina TaxID=2748318 RepID=A0A851GQT9_9BACT|nr:PEP-CTERM sorting domain-containing protein [Oceaniferula marina]NWK56544.1 PEP-CTERM sorting domain-containing protein [Oceaniferula marina]
MTKTTHITMMMAALALPLSAATTWTGGGDGSSFFAEANWTDDGGTPATGPIDPGTALAVDDYFISSTSLTNIGALVLGDIATSLTLNASSIGTASINGTNGAGALILTNGSLYNTQFAGANLTVDIDGTSALTLRGGNDPLPNGASVDLAAGGVINFLAESVGDATSEHLGKITVGGQAAEIGVNVTLVSDGGSGSILTATAVPEPSAAALLGLGGMAMILRRRK